MDIFKSKNRLLENLEEGKSNDLYNLFEKIYDDAVEGVEYDENFGYSSKLFQDYWKENQAEIMQAFKKIY